MSHPGFTDPCIVIYSILSCEVFCPGIYQNNLNGGRNKKKYGADKNKQKNQSVI